MCINILSDIRNVTSEKNNFLEVILYYIQFFQLFQLLYIIFNNK